MKKLFFSIVSTSALLLALASCGGSNENQSSNKGSQSVSNEITYDKNADGYKLTLKYADGSNYQGGENGLKGQWCLLSGMCLSPMLPFDSTGFINNTHITETSDLVVHLNGKHDGYTYNPNNVVNSSNKSCEIILHELKDVKSGSGTQESPYVVEIGAYNVDIEDANAYKVFSFTPSEVGTYVIESLAEVHEGFILDTTLVDPILANGEYSEILNSDLASSNVNFQYELTITADDVNKEFKFCCGLGKNNPNFKPSDEYKTQYPASYEFAIYKK